MLLSLTIPLLCSSRPSCFVPACPRLRASFPHLCGCVQSSPLLLPS